MLIQDPLALAAYKEISRAMSGGVKIYDGSTVSDTLLSTGNLVSWAIERTTPNGKFFGYVAIQKITIEVLGEYPIAKGTKMLPYIDITDSTGHAYVSDLPFFYVENAEINDTKSMTTITGYDIISKAKKPPTIGELELNLPTTLGSLVTKIAEAFGAGATADFGVNNLELDKLNFSGKETLYEVLVAATEATGTIGYVRDQNEIFFRKLNSSPVDTLTTQDYFELTTQDAITLTKVISATALGDNEYNGVDGYTQTFYDNGLIDLRDDRATIVTNIMTNLSGLTIIPHSLTNRGNPFYELGDCITVETLEGESKNIYYLNDTLNYNGGLSSTWFWEVGEKEEAPEANPANLSEAIKQTFAKVDKANSTIEMLVSDVADNKGNITNLKLSLDGIDASVKSIEDATSDAIEGIEGNIDALTKAVETKMTSEEVSIVVKSELANGVDKVKTAEKGFTFDDEGLTVSDSQTNMKTIITENGMTVYRNDEAVLTADNQGVKAEDLHATTYLIIGTNSRFEDYGTNRTGCFWIGGNS